MLWWRSDWITTNTRQLHLVRGIGAFNTKCKSEREFNPLFLSIAIVETNCLTFTKSTMNRSSLSERPCDNTRDDNRGLRMDGVYEVNSVGMVKCVS